jgi:hypothetical protein
VCNAAVPTFINIDSLDSTGGISLDKQLEIPETKLKRPKRYIKEGASYGSPLFYLGLGQT